MDHQQIKDLLPLAALDRVDPDEQSELQQHLGEGCDQCETELRDFKESLAAFMIAETEPAPADAIWRRLQMRLDATHQATPPTSRADTSSAFSTSPISRIERFDSSYQASRGSSCARSRGLLGWGVAGASLAAAALLLILLVSRSYDIARRDRDLLALRSQLQQAQRELAVADKDAMDLRRELDSRTRLTRVLLAPDMEVYKLAPLLPSFGATGLLTVSTSNRTAMLETAGLPIVPEGKVYEFWWIGSQHGPLKGGLFRAESGRETIVAVTAPPVGELIVASAITLEPAGGVSKPTGTMYLKSLPPSR